jgi:hypothetical protein
VCRNTFKFISKSKSNAKMKKLSLELFSLFFKKKTLTVVSYFSTNMVINHEDIQRNKKQGRKLSPSGWTQVDRLKLKCMLVKNSIESLTQINLKLKIRETLRDKKIFAFYLIKSPTKEMQKKCERVRVNFHQNSPFTYLFI